MVFTPEQDIFPFIGLKRNGKLYGTPGRVVAEIFD